MTYPAGRSNGQPRDSRRRPTFAPRGWSRANASTTARAGICRSAPTIKPARSGPIASAAKSRYSGCSSPAGECTSATSISLRAIWCARSAKSALNPEQLLDGKPERLRELDRQGRGRREDAILDRVHGLARDADLFRKLRLSKAELAAPFLDPVGEPVSHRGACAVRGFRTATAPRRGRAKG